MTQKTKDIENVDNVETVEESAAETMKAKGSKSEMMQKVNAKLAGMSIEDLSSFLTKTLAQVGNEPAPDTSGKNKSTITQSGSSAPSPSAKVVKEDVESLFGDEELSEDFKEKASTLFEAAVSNRVTLEVARIEEELETKLEEQVSQSIDELHTQVNDYMDYVVEKWMEENALAVENNFRVETTEKFIEGLKTLFAENYVEVPEEKVDLIFDLESRIAELEESLEESVAESVKLKIQVVDAHRESTFDEVAEGLVETQVEKLRSLAEGVEFSSQEEYREKLNIIRNQYFSENNKESQTTGMIVEENSVGSNDELDNFNIVSEEMKPYYNAISSTVRK
jgi:hypothetical protein